MSGWIWFLIDVVLVAALGALLFYGMMVTRRRLRDRAAQRRSDEATKRLYQEEARKEREEA